MGVMSATLTSSIRVFISYTHDSDTYKQEVLKLSQQLRNWGIDCQIDQYYEQSPPPHWPRWMMDQIEDADNVLVVCTDNYNQRFRGKGNQGKGAQWEGAIITQEIYDDFTHSVKFVPIGFEGYQKNQKNIPLPSKVRRILM